MRKAKVGKANPNWRGGPVIKACEECSQSFAVIPSRAAKARFCSMDCANRKQKRNPDNSGERTPRIGKKCRHCGHEMVLRQKDRQVFCSDDCHRQWRSKKLLSPGGNLYSRSKRGSRPDLGTVFFRSRWEANYARYLNLLKENGVVDTWEFEPETFWFLNIKRGVRSYTPDFRVTHHDGTVYFVEVKGWMDAKSKTKLKRMAKYYPKVEIRVVAKKEYSDIERRLSGVIPNWEKT